MKTLKNAMIIRMDGKSFDLAEMDHGEIEIGGIYTVVEYFNVNSPGTVWYELFPGDTGGISGNANPKIKRYHGWRGTTNDISKTACGVHLVEKIEKYKNGNYKITLGPDLKADEE